MNKTIHILCWVSFLTVSATIGCVVDGYSRRTENSIRKEIALTYYVAGLEKAEKARLKKKKEAKAWEELNSMLEKIRNQLVNNAIRDGKVIMGMHSLEVKQAVGRPSDYLNGSYVKKELRKEGVVEVWRYEENLNNVFDVCFGTDGKVLGVITYR